MKQKYDIIIQEEEKKFINNYKLWQEKNNNWKTVQNDIEKEFEKITKLINASKIKNVKSIISSHFKSVETIQLQFSKEKIGSALPPKSGAEIEEGSALLYSKSINGSVGCFIYNCFSEQYSPYKKYFLYKNYSNPNKISNKEIYKALSFFLMCTRYSSATQSVSIIERIKYIYHASFYDNIAKFFSLNTLLELPGKMIDLIKK